MMARHDDVERLILEDLLPAQCPKFLQNIIQVSLQRISDISQLSQGADIQNIKIESLKDNVCIRLNLPFPVSLLVPRSTEMLSHKLNHYYENNPVGLVAAYLPDLNRFTMLKLYGSERICDYFPERGAPIFRKDIFDHFCPDIKPVPQYSSLNFLLQQKATSKTQVSHKETSLVAHCFEYAYWHMPSYDITGKYDPSHSFIYHTYQKIHEICDVYKTLVKIENVESQTHKLQFVQRELSYQNAHVKILCNGSEHDCIETNICMPEMLASNVQSGDIINAVIANCHRIMDKIPKLILINKIGPIMRSPGPSDFKALVGLIAHLHCNQALDIKVIETLQMDDLVTKIKTLLSVDDFFNSTWNKALEKHSVDTSIIGLYPLLYKRDNSIHIIPPTLINYLSTLDNSHRLEFLYQFIMFINSINVNTKRTMCAFDRSAQHRIRMSDSYNALQKTDPSNKMWKTLFSDLPPLLNYVIYSRILSHSPGKPV